MKNNKTLTFVALAFTTMLTMSFTSINKNTEQDVNAFQTDSIVKAYEDSLVKSSIYIDYPTAGKQVVLDSIRAKIATELASLDVFSAWEAKDKKELYKAKHNGNATEIADYYAKKIYNSFKEEATELFTFMMSDIQIRKVSDAQNFVSFSFLKDYYGGGAHGSQMKYGLTFSKKDGHVLKNPINTSQIKQMQKLLQQGLIQYFKQNSTETDEQSTEKWAEEETAFVIDMLKEIPLPIMTPYLSNEGLVFIYQPYEIGAYAIGMPKFTIPYKDILPYLTKEAKELIK